VSKITKLKRPDFARRTTTVLPPPMTLEEVTKVQEDIVIAEDTLKPVKPSVKPVVSTKVESVITPKINTAQEVKIEYNKPVDGSTCFIGSVSIAKYKPGRM